MIIKRSIFRILSVISLFVLACLPVCNTTNAVGSIDTSRSDGSLALGYKWNNEYILQGVSVHICKVASIDSSGHVYLTNGFENAVLNTAFPNSNGNNDDIYNQQQRANALNLYRYAQNNNIEPMISGNTDASGGVFFNSMEVGVYLITSDSISYDENYRYDFSPFFVCLPYRDDTDRWNYNLTAYPKCTRIDLRAPKVKNRIIKSWIQTEDVTYPKKIVVQIFRNNDFFDEIEMSAAQNWIYEWTVPDDPAVTWSVKEINIPQNYTVSYTVLTSGIPASELGTNPRSVFTITNKHPDTNTPEKPPDEKPPNDITNPEDVKDWVKTGDVSSIAWLTALLSGSGMITLLLGIRRKINSDKSGADVGEKK